MIDTPLKLIVHRTWEQIQHWKKKDRKLQTVTKKIGYSDGTNDNNDQKEHFFYCPFCAHLLLFLNDYTFLNWGDHGINSSPGFLKLAGGLLGWLLNGLLQYFVRSNHKFQKPFH